MALTINRQRPSVFGNKRVILADISFADGDTWNTKFHQIDAFSLDSPSTTAVGATYSGGIITLHAGGAIAHGSIMVVGA